MIIWCSKDSSAINGQTQHLQKSHAVDLELSLWSLEIIITLSKCVLLIFFKSMAEKLLAHPGIEPTILDVASQSLANDNSALATLYVWRFILRSGRDGVFKGEGEY